MTHEQAVAANMAEKYLLGELLDHEKEEFEQHFFECAVCAADMVAGYRLRETIQQLQQQGTIQRTTPLSKTVPVAKSSHRPTWGWVEGLRRNWAAWAAGLLLCGLGYQNLVELPRLKESLRWATSPYIATHLVPFRMGERAGEPAPVVFRHGEPLILNLDIPHEARWLDYEIRISGPSNPPPLSVPADRVEQSVPLVLPKGSLKPGNYQIRVFGRAIGGSAQLLQQGAFRVE
ncbi:MAG: hypothetical protein NZV14_13820 [Bryobacteraceae bacterium]|nr:hypothetical protein [Bryobacteraceae bacterium]MDW8379237.1 hypothetical protein [Bryobacterales bacterium]